MSPNEYYMLMKLQGVDKKAIYSMLITDKHMQFHLACCVPFTGQGNVYVSSQTPFSCLQ